MMRPSAPVASSPHGIILEREEVRRRALSYDMRPNIVDAALAACADHAIFMLVRKGRRTTLEPRLSAPDAAGPFVQQYAKRKNIRKVARSFPEWKRVVEAWYNEECNMRSRLAALHDAAMSLEGAGDDSSKLS